MAQSFSALADLYERARPGYPASAVSFVVSRLGLGPGMTVVDLAAGTGKLTRELVHTGARVVAVEPLLEMRELLAGLVPDADTVDGVAESLPFPDGSVDAVTVAQAFHWFDAEAAFRELARVLRPGGAAALVWNIRALDDPFQQALNDLMKAHRGATPNEHETPWLAVLPRVPALVGEPVRSFPWDIAYTVEELVERIASVSFISQLPDGPRERLLDDVRKLAADLPEPFPFRYRTDVHVLARAPG